MKKTTLLFSFILTSFLTFSQSNSESNYSIFSIHTAVIGEDDVTGIYREQGAVLFFFYDSTSNSLELVNYWSEKETFSKGELWLVNQSVKNDSLNQEVVFVWNYFNSYDDVSGSAFVTISKNGRRKVGDEEFEVYNVEIVLPGRDDLFYETLLLGENNLFEHIAMLN